MAVRKTTVKVAARSRAREKVAAAMHARREREQQVERLLGEHVVAVELAEAERVRADEVIAGHMVAADQAIADLLDLGVSASEVAAMVELGVGEVRAAKQRIAGHGAASAADVERSAKDAIPQQRGADVAPVVDVPGGSTTSE